MPGEKGHGLSPRGLSANLKESELLQVSRVGCFFFCHLWKWELLSLVTEIPLAPYPVVLPPQESCSWHPPRL